MGKPETRNQLATPADGAQNGAPHVGLRGATLSGQEAQGRVLAIVTESSFEKSKVSARFFISEGHSLGSPARRQIAESAAFLVRRHSGRGKVAVLKQASCLLRHNVITFNSADAY